MTAIDRDATLTAAHDAAWRDHAMLEFLTASSVRAFKAQRHGDHAIDPERGDHLEARTLEHDAVRDGWTWCHSTLFCSEACAESVLSLRRRVVQRVGA